MPYTPFDFNEAISQRRDYAEDGLRHGSPVVGLSCTDGLLFLTVRRSQRKVFEIYDRLIYSAIGHQSDIEAIRIGSVDVAHREGYERSPDDVTAQRLVGFSLSPALKETFRDQMRAPAVIRALFGEMASDPARDGYFVLNYDGEFSQSLRCGCVAGTSAAEDAMGAVLRRLESPVSLQDSMPTAVEAWAVGSQAAGADVSDRGDADRPEMDWRSHLRDALNGGAVEAALLVRHGERESRFRMLAATEVAPVLEQVLA